MVKELKGFCNMCGKCCEAIHISLSPEKVEEMAKSPLHANNKLSDPVFIHENWEPISREEAFSINPHFQFNTDRYKEKHEGQDPYENMFFYTCKQFDKETRLCKVHDNLPHVCKGYPWYGGRPHIDELFYDPNCGYKIDVEDSKEEENGLHEKA